MPRIALLLVAGFALFLAATGIYILPTLRETPPPGAIPDYRKERIIARLEGKVLWFLVGSMLTVTILGTLPARGRGGHSARADSGTPEPRARR